MCVCIVGVGGRVRVVGVRWGGKRGVGGELNEAINKIIFYPTKKITAWHCTTNSSAAAPPPPPPSSSRHRTGAELHAPHRLARGGGGRESHARAQRPSSATRGQCVTAVGNPRAQSNMKHSSSGGREEQHNAYSLLVLP